MKKQIIPPVSRYFTDKEDMMPKCEHDVHLDSECKECSTSHNNGGKTDYYDLPKDAKCCQDIIEWRDMNFQQGNIFKVAFTFNHGRHDATTYERELNKIIYFAQRELERIKC